MHRIHAGLHRILDIVTVSGFALAPMLFGLTGVGAGLSYILAGVHLALTLGTRFAPGARGLVPFKVHGAIELIVGVVLLLAPFVLGWIGITRTFYVAAGIVILLVWALSAYDAPLAATVP